MSPYPSGRLRSWTGYGIHVLGVDTGDGPWLDTPGAIEAVRNFLFLLVAERVPVIPNNKVDLVPFFSQPTVVKETIDADDSVVSLTSILLIPWAGGELNRVFLSSAA